MLRIFKAKKKSVKDLLKSVTQRPRMRNGYETKLNRFYCHYRFHYNLNPNLSTAVQVYSAHIKIKTESQINGNTEVFALQNHC